MAFFHEEEAKRFLNQLALKAADYYLDVETGFIFDEKKIPLYLNFCYAMALLSSKLIEDAEKAKILVKKLIPFQSSNGGFPKYLHDFPVAIYDAHQLDIHQVIHEMIHKHARALSKELTASLVIVKQKLWSAIKEHMQIELFDKRSSLKFRIGAFLEDEGDLQKEDFLGFHHSKGIGEILIALRQTPLYFDLLDHYKMFWHDKIGCFCGPLLDEMTQKAQPLISSFDFVMSAYYMDYPRSILEPNLLQFHGALAKTCEVQLKKQKPKYSLTFKNHEMEVVNTDQSSLFFFKELHPKEMEGGKGFHLFRYLWKEKEDLLSLACFSTRCGFQAKEDVFIFDLVQDYPEETLLQDEIEFYCTKHKDVDFFINDQKGALFRLEDLVKITSPSVEISLCFQKIEGDGEFVGHISFGNRPCNVSKKGAKDYTATDLKITLRTLRRSKGCKVRLIFKADLKEQESHKKLPLYEDHCLHTE